MYIYICITLCVRYECLIRRVGLCVFTRSSRIMIWLLISYKILLFLNAEHRAARGPWAGRGRLTIIKTYIICSAVIYACRGGRPRGLRKQWCGYQKSSGARVLLLFRNDGALVHTARIPPLQPARSIIKITRNSLTRRSSSFVHSFILHITINK